jgi:hypothetical protein
MRSGTHTLENLFAGAVRYTVPLFQRKYVWSEEHNWWPLWADLVQTSGRLLADEAQGRNTRPHFLGTVVHEGLAAKTAAIPEHRIIDGQQRMTTLQLALGATRNAARALALADANQVPRLDAMLDNPMWAKGATPEQKFKVWPTNSDRSAFVSAMTSNPDQSLIGRCFTFFQDRVREFVADAEPGQSNDDDPSQGVGEALPEEAENATPSERLDALIITFAELVRLVVIELDGQEDDAQVIFETLNARGTPLLASDLVKNHLFNKAQLAGMDVDALHEKYWATLEEAWWADEDILGRTARHRLDLAIGYWAAAINASNGDIASSHLFGTFVDIATKRLANRNPPQAEEVEALFREIHQYATTWRDLRLAEYSTAGGRFMSRLSDIGTSTPMPMVVWLAVKRRTEPREISDAQFELALTTIESYLVRRAALGLTPKNYNRIFATLLGALERSKQANVGDLLSSKLKDFTEETNVWPEDADFVSALTNENQYQRNLKSRRTRMVLEALEIQMLGPDVEQLAPPGVSNSAMTPPTGGSKAVGGKSFSVEHVMPQSWTTNWPLPDDADKIEEERREAAKHRLGNLTLVTGTKNAGLSNNAWAKKRSYLSSRSLLLLTQAQLLAKPRPPRSKRQYTPEEQAADQRFSDLWAKDPVEAITQRGKVLAAWSLEVWPR